MKQYIFAYGSLMCPESCGRTLHRDVEYLPAKVIGVERKFNAIGSVYHKDSGKNVEVRFANLVNNPESTCLGLMFEVSSEELDKLIAREKFYDLVDISDRVLPQVGKVYTFMCPCNEMMENSFVLKTYVNIMMLASQKFPDLINQIEREFKQINAQEVLEGGFSSITGSY